MTALDDILPAPFVAPRPADWPDPLPDLLSPSSITTFLTCPEQWRRVYLQHERSRSNGNLLIGRADSKARELDLGQKITTGINMPLETVKEIAGDTFDKEVESEGGINEVEWDTDKGETAGTAKDMAVGVAAAYRQQVAETVVPIAVEREVRVDVAGIVPGVRGYMDVEETPVVRENKTAAKRMTKPTGPQLIQTLLYSAATGKPTSFDISVKKKQPEVVTAATEPGLLVHTNPEEVLQRLSRVTTTVVESIVGMLDQRGPDDPWLGTGAGQVVSPCGWCDFKASCPFYFGPKG